MRTEFRGNQNFVVWDIGNINVNQSEIDGQYNGIMQTYLIQMEQCFAVNRNSYRTAKP